MSHNSNLALQVSDFPLKYLFVFKLYRHLSQNPGVIHDISIFLHIQYQGMSLLFLVDMEFITWTFSASFSLENCPSLSLRSTFLSFSFLFTFFLSSVTPFDCSYFSFRCRDLRNHTIWFTLSSTGPFSFYLFPHSNSHSCSYPPWLGRHVWSTSLDIHLCLNNT